MHHGPPDINILHLIPDKADPFLHVTTPISPARDHATVCGSLWVPPLKLVRCEEINVQFLIWAQCPPLTLHHPS